MGLFSKNKSGYKVFKDGDGKWQSVHKRVAEKKWEEKSLRVTKFITKTVISWTTVPQIYRSLQKLPIKRFIRSRHYLGLTILTTYHQSDGKERT